jgi:hypothetical protein
VPRGISRPAVEAKTRLASSASRNGGLTRHGCGCEVHVCIYENILFLVLKQVQLSLKMNADVQPCCSINAARAGVRLGRGSWDPLHDLGATRV